MTKINIIQLALNHWASGSKKTVYGLSVLFVSICTLFFSEEAHAQYCVPGTNGSSYSYIMGVQIGGINNTTGAVIPLGYSDFTAQSASFPAGSVVQCNVSVFDGRYMVFVDYNNDFDFLDTDENVIFDLNLGSSFIIPCNTPTGSYRMRIISNYFNTSGGSCFTEWGETEDYTLVVTSSVFQQSVSVSPSTGLITCTNSSVALEALGGASYNWGSGNNNAINTVSASGTYTVSITGATGCTATASAVVSQSTTPPSVAITPSGSTTICPPQTVTLTAGGASSYVWSGAGSGNSNAVTASAGGNYCVVGTNAFNGCTAQACVNVTQFCAPTFDCATNSSGQPAAPTLALGANPYSQVVATFANTNAVGGYTIMWRVQGSAAYSFITTYNLNYTITSLQPGTTYEVRVVSRCSNYFFRYSNWSTITTQAMSGCGSAAIACGTSTSNSIGINWAAQPNAIGYRIRYQKVGLAGYSQISIAAGGINAQNITNLLSNSVYNIWILTQCVNGQFYQSNTIQCSTSGSTPLMATDMPLNFAYNGIEYVNMPANEIRIAELDALTGDFEVDFSNGTPEIQPLVAGAQIGFGIVPNPAHTHFDVVLATDQSVDTQIILTDINGAVIMSQSSATPIVSFDTQDLPAGIYMVTVKTATQSQTQKVVILK